MGDIVKNLNCDTKVSSTYCPYQSIIICNAQCTHIHSVLFYSKLVGLG